MGFWQVQSLLSRGEIDPRYVGRIDLPQYYQAMALGRNLYSMPQGGVTKRPGTEYRFEIASAPRIEAFEFSVDQSYLFVFTSSSLSIYRDGVLKDTLVTPWFGTQVQEFDYIQRADTVIITHPDYQPQRILRETDISFTIDGCIETFPLFDYNDGISPVPSAEIQRLTFTGSTNGDRLKISFNGFLSDEFIHNIDDDGVSTATDIEKELNSLPNVKRDSVTVAKVGVGGLVFDITFGGESATEWDNVKVTPIYVKNATTWAFTVAQTQAGVSRLEEVWSPVRGWPRTCTFHEGRLFFGGSKSLPNTIWGSYVADYFRFLPDAGLDDEPIQATLDTDQINVIEAIYSNRSLQIFTEGAEFYAPGSPLTPENIAVQRQTSIGSKRVRPVTIDGFTLFLQRTGNALYQFMFVDAQKANASSSISILAPHLIKDPIKMAVKRGTSDNDANYVYILNSDGTLTVFNTLSSQDIAGFTRWETRTETDEIVSIATVSNELYLAVARDVDGATVYYVEKENEDFYMDCAMSQSGSDFTTITGLSYLEGETVKVKADGAVRDDAVVSGGEVVIDPGADYAEVGLDFRPTVTTLPLNVPNLQGGPNAALRKRILRVALQIYESNGVIVNGRRIPDRVIGQNQFDPPEPITGLKRLFLPGYSLEAQVTITQDTPFPFTILSIANEVKI